MGASKVEFYSPEIIEIANIAKVFSHPARVAIIKHISEQNTCICNDLVDEIGLAQPTISQHLDVINKAGLLKGDYKGISKCYCINKKGLQNAQALLSQFFQTATSKCC
ncbi:MAG: metalloregulator ArsR/SmtB family transcription factor [Winogradskyella sp.]|nr:metalloregulator ArsR/SmtB family transcription factor [Winogradskyella sp.]